MTLPNTTVFKSAMRQTMTWGVIPDWKSFSEAFREDLGEGPYEIRNCRELDAVYHGGNIDFTCEELYDFILEAEGHGFDTNHELSDLVSSILYTLGFEWV